MPEEPTRPAVIVQLSDLHLEAGHPGREARLQATIAAARSVAPTPTAVLVTGDLSNGGAAEGYATAARLLSAWDAPIHVVPGNVDDRAALRAAFDLPGTANEPVCSVVDAGPLRLVLTDSTIPGEIPGRLDVAWLEAQLQAEPGRPTLVAFHHPAYAIGVPGLDGIGLAQADRDAVASLVRRSPQVVGLTHGHVHRASTGTVGGRPATTAPAIAFSMQLDLDGGAPAPGDEGPGFLVHVWTGDALVTHVVPVA